jgi:hypothetical protein
MKDLPEFWSTTKVTEGIETSLDRVDRKVSDFENADRVVPELCSGLRRVRTGSFDVFTDMSETVTREVAEVTAFSDIFLIP